jgi:uncharacterized membrane protein YdbT with pleckstrin-like domain
MAVVKRSHIKRRIATLVFGIAALAVLFVISPFIGGFFLPLVAIVVAACVLNDLANYLTYSSTRIENTEKGVAFSKGIVNRSIVNYPYSKITSTRMDVSLADRLFGLKTLMIDTAGEEGMDLIITDLPAKDCDAFYKELTDNISSTKGKGND